MYKRQDEYCDYITIDGERYYGSCLETATDYIYVVIPDGEMTDNRLPVVLATVAASLVCLLVVFLLITFGIKGDKKIKQSKEKNDSPMVDVVMPDGTVKQTEAAASRWSNLSLKWAEKTPEQQIGEVLKVLLGILAAVICLAVIFKDTFFDKNSIFLYVLNGKWERSVNVFAFTGCIMTVSYTHLDVYKRQSQST